MHDERTAFAAPLSRFGGFAQLGSVLLLVACGTTTSGPAGDGSASGSGSSSGGSNSSLGGSISAGGAIIEGPQCANVIVPTTQLPRLLNRQYASVMHDLLGVSDLDGKAIEESLVGDFDGPMNAPAWLTYQDVAAKIAAKVLAGPNKSRFISCDPAADGCLKQTIQSFGRKAFRHPLSTDEVARFEALGHTTPPGTPDQIAEATLTAFLVSPSFLYLPELSSEREGNAIKLSASEVATRLSFLIWGSIPDDELNDAADRNLLSTKQSILEQAERMIQVREKTGPVVSAFHAYWSQMSSNGGHWFKLDHDPVMYPGYDPAAKTSYRQELERFFAEVAFGGGSFPDLLLSKLAFVNQDNAAIYGLDPAKYTSELTQVTLDAADAPRPGFLTRAGFLSSYATYQATSPILRGAFIANLLGVDVGPPIPGTRAPLPQVDAPTERQYVEALTEATEPCKTCHAIINPFGFVLENYSAIGKWQVQDPRGGAIDAAAEIKLADGTTRKISSPMQLMQEIARNPRAQRNYARAWVSFAYQRSADQGDQCLVDQLALHLSGDGYTILDLLADLTQSDSFRLRVAASP